ncbi:nucleotide sugar dehydrogenase [Halomonas daqiaonensis]|uniref:UDP-N-acetyl-D-galactosamine dehydrogenase n=1 Tax=Halomonas daqiaonensis TaxID=650850 RepID=A0A1H7LSV8_9GAMM|nr:nucleotide sugar dehydrogenase [Halomonas daqiaonensis]SEL01437.1 UDP-N-acetyl-D-galactosamine dehydrogenase [Halomonas daqiaonensis]
MHSYEPLPDDPRIAVIGLGYVGLPLANAFSSTYSVVGFDIDAKYVEELQKEHLRNQGDSDKELASVEHCGLFYTSDPASIASCNVFIITVPTPVDEQKKPDLSRLIRSSETVGSHLSPGSVVIYESTVYPGTTEEECVPVLELASGLTVNRDFYVGYSPERVNPGDSAHSLTDIVKITSGSTPEAALFVDSLYSRIIVAGTHRVSKIAVAEAAKVTENIQRDVNIALMNELAIQYNLLELDTEEVLKAAGTKWNFMPFRPGLVGGHCMSVDPYYLIYKSRSEGYEPALMSSARRLNDSMWMYVASQVAKLMAKHGTPVLKSRILVLGLAFKENSADLRNTQVPGIIREFSDQGAEVDVHDPHVAADVAERELGIALTDQPNPSHYDAVILAVAHTAFHELGAKGVRNWLKPGGVLYDVKSVFSADQVEGRL